MTARPLTVIVHLPYELQAHPDSAPQLRPRRIIDGFRSLGADVTVVSGKARDRKVQMREVLHSVKEGRYKPTLVYSESSGWPNAFSEGRKTSFHPRLDVKFLRSIRRFGVPIGLFYRDVYSLDPSYYDVPLSSRLRRYVLAWLGKRDRQEYSSYVDRLYFPSLLMARRVSEYHGQVDELPPGATIRKVSTPAAEKGARGLNLLYVGGLGALYQLHLLVRVVASLADVSLTICTREADWESQKHEYIPLLNDNVSIVHKSDDELDALYDWADLTVLTVAPSDYRTFTYPVKLFDYIGYGLPIIATKGTLVAQYVEEHNLGWTVSYDDKDLRDLLGSLSDTKTSVFEEARSKVVQHRNFVSWERRAQKVIDDLA